jgi:hypothetical protein
MSHEYEYEMSALFPDGLAFNPAHSNPEYPPGSPKMHQCDLLVDFRSS